MIKTEKKILLFESVHPEFFKTGKSEYSDTMDSLPHKNQLLLSQLADHRIICKTAAAGRVSLLINLMSKF
ncbi:MAG: hypothetical protein ACOC4J_03775 [Bacteroidota bacterium]